MTTLKESQEAREGVRALSPDALVVQAIRLYQHPEVSEDWIEEAEMVTVELTMRKNSNHRRDSIFWAYENSYKHLSDALFETWCLFTESPQI